MYLLERGKQYPLPTTGGEGARVDFLSGPDNILQIILHGMTCKENTALRSGRVDAGIIYKGGELLWLFQFYDNNGAPLLELDAPFDVRLIDDDLLNIPSGNLEGKKLLIVIHAIDEKNILRAIRGVTIPSELTMKFLSSVREQKTITQMDSCASDEWNKKSIPQLINCTDMYVLGR